MCVFVSECLAVYGLSMWTILMLDLKLALFLCMHCKAGPNTHTQTRVQFSLNNDYLLIIPYISICRIPFLSRQSKTLHRKSVTYS